MNLKVLLPFQVYVQKVGVLRLIAETRTGSFGLLPHRRDCIATLVPGILTYETPEDGTTYLAVDEGVLVKAGAEIMVSVRHAISGADLGQLRDAVEREYLTLDRQERDVRAAVARMEASLMHGLMEFDHGR